MCKGFRVNGAITDKDPKTCQAWSFRTLTYRDRPYGETGICWLFNKVGGLEVDDFPEYNTVSGEVTCQG